ncbi:MAG: zinc ribbon domain-containing protein [Desulfobacterales bacterium]|nr:zinc ribbon domain-containing protein [Desulfobacterales bacterium]
MFIIAGVSPKTTVIDKQSQQCPVCGLSQAYFKRTDYYFNLFFIPLFRVKKGDSYLMCERCEREITGFGVDPAGGEMDKGRCVFCGSRLDGKFKYCPQCGKKTS